MDLVVLAIATSITLGIFLVVWASFLLERTFSNDKFRRWGWSKLATAWSGWILLAAFAVAILLPIHSGYYHEEPPRSPCVNNLKRIGLAIHNYSDTYHRLPPAYTVDKDGHPLHSWRVLILPFIEQNELYQRIRLDEPWYSPHNREVFESVQSPSGKGPSTPFGAYWCPKDETNVGQTNYMRIVGPRMITNGPNSVHYKDVTDGLSNTILCVEVAGLGVRWYEPIDLRVDTMSFKCNDPGRSCPSSRHPNCVNVLLGDGSVRNLPPSIDPRLFEAMTTINGGENLESFVPKEKY